MTHVLLRYSLVSRVTTDVFRWFPNKTFCYCRRACYNRFRSIQHMITCIQLNDYSRFSDIKNISLQFISFRNFNCSQRISKVRWDSAPIDSWNFYEAIEIQSRTWEIVIVKTSRIICGVDEGESGVNVIVARDPKLNHETGSYIAIDEKCDQQFKCYSRDLPLNVRTRGRRSH